MPTYSFLNTETGEEFEIVMRISERDQFMVENPHLQPIILAPALVSGSSTSKQNRVPEGFKEVQIGRAHV